MLITAKPIITASPHLSFLLPIPCPSLAQLHQSSAELLSLAVVVAVVLVVLEPFSDGKHCVSFDHVVHVMKLTGHDLPSLYKETSEGGLAKEYLKDNMNLQK